MWLFTLDGFYSAVQDKDNPDRIMVRTRQKADLERLVAKMSSVWFSPGQYPPEILEWTGSDYRFRVFVPRSAWRVYVTQAATELTYTNFKAAAIPPGDPDRSRAYHRVWNALKDWQDRREADEQYLGRITGLVTDEALDALDELQGRIDFSEWLGIDEADSWLAGEDEEWLDEAREQGDL